MASGRSFVSMPQERVRKNEKCSSGGRYTVGSHRNQCHTSPGTSQHKFSKHRFSIKPRTLSFSSNSHHCSPSPVTSHHKKKGQKYGLSEFDDFQMVGDKSVVDQAYKISRMVADHAQSCPRLHMVLNDKVELVNVIIEKLPESWEYYAATLKDMQMQKELSFGALVNHLTVEEEKRAQDQKVEEKECSRYLPLYKAALRGDWATAEIFFDQDSDALTAPINEFSETALYVAAVNGRNANDFVKKLVDKMPPDTVDEAYGNVLKWAAYVGNTEGIKVLLSKKPYLVYYRDDNERTPFTMAAANGMRDTLLYLLELVKNDEDSSKLFPDGNSAAALMDQTIRSGYYDIALYLVKKYPLSAFSVQNNGSFGLISLAMKAASAFKSGTHYQWWQRIIYALVPVKSVDRIMSCIISPTLTVSVENSIGSPTQTVSVGSPTQTVENPVGSPTLTVLVENPVGSPTQTVSVESPTQTVSVENLVGNPTLTVSVENPVGSLTQPVSVESPTQTVSVENLVAVENPVGSPTQTVSVENPVGNRDQVMGWSSYNLARRLVEYFCISVPCIKHIQEQKEKHLQTLELVKRFCWGIKSLPDSAKHRSLTQDAIFWAAKNGIPEIVHEIVKSFPSVLWTVDTSRGRVFENAVLERQENTFNLIYQMGEYSRECVLKQYDYKDNHILHLAGKLAPPTKLSQISGAALQMQLELQWFEAVKKLMSPRDIDRTNSDSEIAAMIFTEEHKKLVAEGEKWMKDTANSCTIPAALIVTMVFAALITIPGGINGTNGIPILHKEVVFNIFAVSDAISLFTSTTSLLVLLSILTSRYAERDFLFSLPNRLIIGLFTLFLSITAMLIAFSCAIYLLFGNRAWILYPVAGLACVPIISFASLQYPLLRDLVKSTYGPGIFGKQSEVSFFN